MSINAKKAWLKLVNHNETYHEKKEKVRKNLIWKLWNQICTQYEEAPDLLFGEITGDTTLESGELLSDFEKIELNGRALDIYTGACMILNIKKEP